MSNPFDRGLMLNAAAYKLGLDEPTRGAMPLIDTFIETMVKEGYTWEDVPERFGIEQIAAAEHIGAKVLELLRRDSGFQLFEEAIDNPLIRQPLLDSYFQVLEIAAPGEEMTIPEFIKFAQSGELDNE